MSRSPRYWLLALAVFALTATTYLLSSCTLVNEPLVSIAQKKTGKCVKECREDFREQERECAKELRRDSKECRRLPTGPARDTCLREAVEEFISCSNQASEDRQACLNGCHDQGGGGGF